MGAPGTRRFDTLAGEIRPRSSLHERLAKISRTTSTPLNSPGFVFWTLKRRMEIFQAFWIVSMVLRHLSTIEHSHIFTTNIPVATWELGFPKMMAYRRPDLEITQQKIKIKSNSILWISLCHSRPCRKGRRGMPVWFVYFPVARAHGPSQWRRLRALLRLHLPQNLETGAIDQDSCRSLLL